MQAGSWSFLTSLYQRGTMFGFAQATRSGDTFHWQEGSCGGQPGPGGRRASPRGLRHSSHEETREREREREYIYMICIKNTNRTSIKPADCHKLTANVSCWAMFLCILLTFNYLLVEMLKKNKLRNLCRKHLNRMTKQERHFLHYHRCICVTLPASPVFRVEVNPSESAEQSHQTRVRDWPQPGRDSRHQTCDQKVLKQDWAQHLVWTYALPHVTWHI